MSNSIWLFSLLPLLPAFVCILLLVKLHQRGLELDSIKLFYNLLLMNLAQVVAYCLFAVNLDLAERAADAYLILAYFFFAHLLLFAHNLGRENEATKRYEGFIYIIPCLLTVFHLSGLMTNGYRVEGNALMHEDGSLSWCLDLFIMGACLGSLATLMRKLVTEKENPVAISKNMLALIAFVPLALAFFIIVLLSETQYAVPVVIIGPSVSLYTALIFYYLSRTRVVDLSLGINFFVARLKLAYKLLELPRKYKDQKAFSEALTRELIRESFVLNLKDSGELDFFTTAEYYGVNHTTLRKKAKEFGFLTEHELKKRTSI